jgi:hypothetical protein
LIIGKQNQTAIGTSIVGSTGAVPSCRRCARHHECSSH